MALACLVVGDLDHMVHALDDIVDRLPLHIHHDGLELLHVVLLVLSPVPVSTLACEVEEHPTSASNYFHCRRPSKSYLDASNHFHCRRPSKSLSVVCCLSLGFGVGWGV